MLKEYCRTSCADAAESVQTQRCEIVDVVILQIEIVGGKALISRITTHTMRETS